MQIPILLTLNAQTLWAADQAHAMAAALKGAGKPYEWVDIPATDAFFSRTEDRLALLKAVEGFLGRCMARAGN